MVVYRCITREQCLEAIENRRTKGWELTRNAEHFFISPRALNMNLHHYGLWERWTKAKQQYMKSVCDKAIKFRKKGHTIEMLEEELGITIDRIESYINKCGRAKEFQAALLIKNKVRPYRNLKRGRRKINLSWLYLQRCVFGLTYAEIGMMCGYNKSTIHRLCKEMGYEKPSKQESSSNRQNATALFMNYERHSHSKK